MKLRQDEQDKLRIDQNPQNDEPFVLIRAEFLNTKETETTFIKLD
jgi:hypothetical protein